LPNGAAAVVDIRKLREYCLSLEHPRGRHKARVFAALGIGPAEAEGLQAALLSAAREQEAEYSTAGASPYGERYVIDFEWVRIGGRVRIRSAWIVREGENVPRLTSCYVI